MFTSTMLRAGLALLTSTRLVAAQGLNLTLTFYPDKDNTCSDDGSKAISFSTGSQTFVQSCFNLDEIFANNSTGASGTPRQLVHTIGPYEQLGGPTGQDDGKVTWASRRVNIYNGDDCLQAVSPDNREEFLPWISWTCYSSEDDQCRTAPYNIKSFVIIPLDDDDKDGKCLDFAVGGDSARSLPHTFGALVTAIVVGFFFL
ncbi:hypothetical protein NUW58_g3324 [Xylaria curta]|uniref:Uncharacterized protein n=1 Tax=Xylaria curta TaxID=42375 RepID=A0ACC1PBH5_9PEZI|nr:hypothetical protein NUW58_g3324 [Xylaria curta]